jgi:Flp pilus assembly protein TadG
MRASQSNWQLTDPPHGPGRSRRSRQHATRRGTAVAELAVCLPMLALLVFGSIQACDLIYLKHAVVTAAYEGSLELAKPSATNVSVVGRVQQVLNARNVSGTTVEILPSNTDINVVNPGQPITISVTANTGPNLMFSGFFLSPADVFSSVVATR